MRSMMVWLLGMIFMSSAAAVTEQEAFGKVCSNLGDYEVEVIEDPLFDRVVGAGITGEHDLVIRTNPEALPRLLTITRQFLLANECARLQSGAGIERELSLAEARQLDCAAVDLLRKAQLLQDNALKTIATDLHLSEAEWGVVSGPQRNFDFSGCGLSVQVARQATRTAAGQPASLSRWNACVRACAKPLLTCNTSGCIDTYNQCVAGCDARSPG